MTDSKRSGFDILIIIILKERKKERKKKRKEKRNKIVLPKMLHSK